MSAELAAAVATAGRDRRRPGAVAGLERAVADGAAGGAIRRQALPDLDEQVVERRPAGLALVPPPHHRRSGWGLEQRRRAHETLRYSPTTPPRICTSFVRIGSYASVSGRRRVWAASPWEPLTVAPSPTTPTTTALPTARSSSSIARGLDGSRRSSPTFSRLARCACTVEDDASPTAFPMSRTVGG